MKRGLFCILAATASLPAAAQGIDQNSNSQSDVWEMVFGAVNLPPDGDADGDGWTNAQESIAGTNPFDPNSHPRLDISGLPGGAPVLMSQTFAGKRYTLYTSSDLVSWAPAQAAVSGNSGTMSWPIAPAGGRAFFKLQAEDQDSDGDGVSDWEELTLGLNPANSHTGRYEDDDAQIVKDGLNPATTDTISVAVYDDTCWERWPAPGVLVVRRSGSLRPLTVNVSLTGSAIRNTDYTSSITGTAVTLGIGQREAFVLINPIADANDAEGDETATLTVLPDAGYTVGTPASGNVTIINQTASSPPSPKEAARFLIQAAFGPDQDSPDDDDQIPQNVQDLMSRGIPGWIDDQLARPVGYLTPMMQWQKEQPDDAAIYNDRKQNAWWGRAMGLPKLRPDATEEQLPDPLRQRVAFALSQIFVIGDRMERLATEPEAMAHYYDTLLKNSFGNFETLLHDVALHPCMGIYLSDLGNRKADPVANTFPDENFAREVMQLFSIGLWKLNPDGSRVLDVNGQPISTYTNADITEFARVFTGLSYSALTTDEPLQFGSYNGDFTKPMKGWDEYHDLGAKTLLGNVTPARTLDPNDDSAATAADVDAAIHTLATHQNVGPFIGRQLIQRLVTSNPSPAYIGRVAAAFNASPRGDLGRTVKAILMDPEARDPAKMSDPTFGKLREPFLKVVNVARGFNAYTDSGWYYLDAFDIDHLEQPLDSSSVFNFYLPSYSPPGPLAQAGLVAPEMQLINASSAVTAPNYYWDHLFDGLARWGVADPTRTTKLNITQEMLMNVPPEAVDDPYPNVQPLDPDPLIRRLDLALTGGTLTPQSFQIIHEALARIGPGSAYEWPKSRLKLAIYLIVCSPEFSIQH